MDGDSDNSLKFGGTGRQHERWPNNFSKISPFCEWAMIFLM